MSIKVVICKFKINKVVEILVENGTKSEFISWDVDDNGWCFTGKSTSKTYELNSMKKSIDNTIEKANCSKIFNNLGDVLPNEDVEVTFNFPASTNGELKSELVKIEMEKCQIVEYVDGSTKVISRDND